MQYGAGRKTLTVFHVGSKADVSLPINPDLWVGYSGTYLHVEKKKKEKEKNLF